MRLKAPLLILGICVMLIYLSGCETVKGSIKGASQGFVKDWQNTKENLKEMKENLKKIDDWMRENLW